MCFRRVVLALVALVILASAVMVTGCGHRSQLISIQVIPDNVTFGGSGLVVDYKAMGSYINPTQTVDITKSVLWQSVAPGVISIDPATGVATSGPDCGANITITATHFANQQAHSGGEVVGMVTANVTCGP